MLDRRQMLLGVGGTALVGMGALSCKRAPVQVKGAAPFAPTETWANGICQLCTSACGLRVRLVNGHPVSVRGNPTHPVNRGGLCARGAVALQAYYDPDRLRGPVRRDPAVVGGWAKVAWDDALSEIAARARDAVATDPARLTLIRGSGHDLTSQLWGRLIRAAGSPWVIDLDEERRLPEREVLRRMHGTSGRLVPDLAGARFLLSVESDLLEAAEDSMPHHRGFAAMRAAGGQFVHAGPRLGITGAKADEWLPIRPGTGGIFALGVAHMLIKEGFARAEFLGERALHFEDWRDEAGHLHPGARSFILREFSPRRVGEITGVGWDRVIRVARAFGESPYSLAVGPRGWPTASPVFDQMAIHALNAIAGAIDRPGGVLLSREPPFEPLDEIARGAEGSSPSPALEAWVDRVLSSRTVPVDVAILHEADPVFETPYGERVAEALRRVPLVVSTSPVLTDTAQCAHLVLPDALWIERRSDAVASDGKGHPIFAVAPPAARRRADSRDAAEVALSLAHRVGPPVSARFPWRRYGDVLRDRLKAVLDSDVGDAFSDVHRSTWMQLLERGGWRTPSYRDLDMLAAQVDARGGWWDPVYYHGEWRRLAPGPGHRIDLGPLEGELPADALQQARAPQPGALWLVVYREQALHTRLGASLPGLQDLGSPLSELGWTTLVELHPETAAGLKIAHGDRVSVRSPRGEITATARITPAIRPDVAAVHTGRGRESSGRFAQPPDGNPARLVTVQPEGRTGRAALLPTAVRLERAG